MNQEELDWIRPGAFSLRRRIPWIILVSTHTAAMDRITWISPHRRAEGSDDDT